MGKNTDKSYISRSEWTNEAPGSEGGMRFGGASGKPRGQEAFRRLPFSHCAISLGAFEAPYCAPDGAVFDLVNIVPFLRRHGVHPLTGAPLAMRDLTALHFYRNAGGEYHCPVTFKVFGEHTKIVAVRTTGNVYAWDAVEELNIGPKNWKDLLTDEPFKRSDLIVIQDPHNLEARSINGFYYRTHELAVPKPAGKEKAGPAEGINTQGTAAHALKELEARREGASVTPSFVSKEALPFNAAHFSDNRMAMSLTSTASTPQTVQQRAVVDEEELMFKRVKGPAYAAVRTNVGQLNVELFCEKAPRACFNFISLAKAGRYDGTVFHRSIRRFMIQGGDPTGTGKGGESIWGKPFKDEIAPGLSHDARGILSMANRGPGTNTSQFFVTFGPCKHLDGKHTIFGKVVGNLQTIDKLESVETDKATDRPKAELKIEDVQVFVDPFEEFQAKRREQQSEREAKPEDKPAPKPAPLVAKHGGVGKYLDLPAAGSARKREAEDSSAGADEKRRKE